MCDEAAFHPETLVCDFLADFIEALKLELLAIDLVAPEFLLYVGQDFLLSLLLPRTELDLHKI